MEIRDLMTPDPACCRPGDSVQEVAKLMAARHCGEIPVCDGTRLVGVITDRDIVLRVVAAGRVGADVKAQDVMTTEVYTIRLRDDIEDALDVMEANLVRRLPVLDDGDAIVGIVSQSDLIAKSPTLKIARAMRSVAIKTRRPPQSVRVHEAKGERHGSKIF